ncbi:MAG: PhzF family phenazine biosynthesis protein [Haliscomenobacter sp.]|uniref:PhzF family phenazine biosynthesis protein n=1 Tax=Haliscomenobacter sp. TaxID=2717303 RepID=UPI0029A3A69D|nr:PhzF family phenazine biosynthesis protein [Haliscomenobacter sp.]MDX2070204.1 PhzF family phenazine biosynthesis protein [Haliscomenobacter sp.]
MKIPFFIVDTFTSFPFQGNPTGVCVLDHSLDASSMLSIAQELQFPVSAFIQKKEAAHFYIQYYTQTTEIPACGHATLAAAKVVFEFEKYRQLQFFTIEGIQIEVEQDSEIIWMKYPRYELEDWVLNPKILASLGLKKHVKLGFCTALESLFIEIAEPGILRNLQPSFSSMIAADSSLKEVVVMSPSDDPEFDFLLRSFCPWIGIDEDPVTGSVHSVLAHYWQQKLKKQQLKAFQCSQRGGEVYVMALPDRVELGGKVVMLVKGTLAL